MTTKWQKVLPHAIEPCKAGQDEAGFDLYLVETAAQFGNVTVFDTGIAIQPDDNTYYLLYARSSIIKSGYMLANGVGVIDRTYRGTIKVALLKTDHLAPELSLPCKLVQIVPQRMIRPILQEVDELDETTRGNGGFGSTDNPKN